MPDKVLILGGTAEGAACAARLAAAGIDVVTSLAGRLEQPPDLAGRVRTGGFGGAAGLVRYLQEEGVRRVIDATHPFAATISRHAAEACRLTGLPLERLIRPAWKRRPGDRWHWADDMAMAARMAPKLGQRVFLTTGAQSLPVFAAHGGPFYLIRLIEAPRRLAFPRHALCLGKGPFGEAGEARLMARFGIDLLVTKASGGEATAAKLSAARRLGIPVLLVRRPSA